MKSQHMLQHVGGNGGGGRDKRCSVVLRPELSISSQQARSDREMLAAAAALPPWFFPG